LKAYRNLTLIEFKLAAKFQVDFKIIELTATLPANRSNSSASRLTELLDAIVELTALLNANRITPHEQQRSLHLTELLNSNIELTATLLANRITPH